MKRVILLLVLLCLSCIVTGTVAGADVALNGQPVVDRSNWDQAKNVTVDSVSNQPFVTKVQPVIVRNGSDSTTGNGDFLVNWDEYNIDGPEDFVFTNSTGFVFPYEVASFNATAQNATFWVYSNWTRDGTAQAQMVYGNNTNDTDWSSPRNVYGNTGNGANPWGQTGVNTTAVYHIDQLDKNKATTDSVFDSSPNANDGSATGVVDADGQVGRAGDFDGSNDFIDTFIVNEPEITIALWVNLDDFNPGFQQFFGAFDGTVQLRFGVADTKDISWKTFDGTSYGLTGIGVNWNTNEWHQLVGTFDSNNGYQLYEDGDSLASSSDTTFKLPSNPSHIANENRGTDTAYTDGLIDLVRVFSEPKNEVWAQSDYDASPKAGQVFFSQSASFDVSGNAPPTIHSKRIEPIDPNVGDFVSYFANRTDADGDTIIFNNLTVETDSTTLVSDAQGSVGFNGSEANWTDIITWPNESRWINATFEFTDNNSNTATGQLNKRADYLSQWNTTDKNGNAFTDFDATFSNGTAAFDVQFDSNSNGNLKAWVSELPTGNTSATFSAFAHNKNTTYYNITSNFSVNETIRLQPTDFALSTQDEQTGNFIAGNVTLTNKTAIYETISHLDISSVSQSDGKTKTFDFNNTIAPQFISADFEGSGSGGESVDFIAQYIDGSTETMVSFSSFESSNTITKTASFNSAGKVLDKIITDNSGGSGSISYKGGVIQNRGKLSGDTNSLLANTSMPIGNATILVSNNQYVPRQYFTQIGNNKDSIINTYLLLIGQGQYMNIEVQDGDGTTLSNAAVNVQKRFGLNYKTISQTTTSTDGTSTFYLDPATKYRAAATKTGYASFEGTFSATNYQFDPLIIRLSNLSDFEFTSPWQSITYQFRPTNNSLENKTQFINFSITDSDSSLNSFGLDIINETGSFVNATTVTGSPSGGTATLYHNMSKLTGQTITARGRFTKNNTQYNVTKTYIIRKPLQTGNYSIQKAVQTFEEQTTTGTQFFLALILTLGAATFVGSAIGGMGGGLTVLTILGAFAWVGWVPRFIYIMTIIAAAAVYMQNSR